MRARGIRSAGIRRYAQRQRQRQGTASSSALGRAADLATAEHSHAAAVVRCVVREWRWFAHWSELVDLHFEALNERLPSVRLATRCNDGAHSPSVLHKAHLAFRNQVLCHLRTRVLLESAIRCLIAHSHCSEAEAEAEAEAGATGEEAAPGESESKKNR